MENMHKKEDNDVEGRCNCGSIQVWFDSGLAPDLLICYWYYVISLFFLTKQTKNIKFWEKSE